MSARISYKFPHIGTGITPSSLSFRSLHLFSMVQLHHLLFPLAALSGALSFSIGPYAEIPIVNKEIAPDGYSRP
jgi:hypothetical protein